MGCNQGLEVLLIIKRYKQKIISYSEKYIRSFYNDMDATFGKPSHYTIGWDITAQIVKE